MAVTEFFHRVRPVAFRINLAILHDRGLAEDVLGDTILKLWEQRLRILPTMKSLEHLTYYFIRMNRNRCATILKRRSLESPLEEVELPGEGNGEQAEIERHLHEHVLRCLNSLPNELMRRAIVLRVLLWERWRIVAGTLFGSSGSSAISRARRLISKGLKLLQDCLQKRVHDG